jgi:hypothetical protein
MCVTGEKYLALSTNAIIPGEIKGMSQTSGREKVEAIEITNQEAEELLCRVESKELTTQDYETIKWLIKVYFWLNRMVEKKKLSIKRLKRVFGIKTEKSKDILKEDESKEEENAPEETGLQESESSGKKKTKGHGRNGVSAYSGLEHKEVPHPEVTVGDICPDCEKGKLYELKPSRVVRINSQPLISGKVYNLQKLRCKRCNEVFTAPLPPEAGKEKYSEETGSMLAILKYDNGFPFNRLKNFQDNFGIPLPSSTQWEIIEQTANRVYPVHDELIRLAAQGEIIYNDDTPVKILSHIKEKKEGVTHKSTYTTGIISKVGKRLIVLYFSGENHAGENLCKLLRNRAKKLGPPIQMCDGLSRNLPKGFETILVNCLSHGRRKFVELYDSFEPECRVIIEGLKKVYHNEEFAQGMQMSPTQRLQFHQEKSKPVMDRLKNWMDQQIEGNIVEPNSSLGEAINYMRKRWESLTGFLHIENAPLDNNITERALKKAILNRKNAYFYKTEFGAQIGDIFISLIQTCIQAKVNAFEYLTLLQKNAMSVLEKPGNWLPWNYKETLAFQSNV